jgi:hypothetical protein
LSAISLILIGVGIIIALAGLFNWSWFMERQAQRLFSFEKMIGRNGARIAFVILGAIFIILGVLN